MDFGFFISIEQAPDLLHATHAARLESCAELMIALLHAKGATLCSLREARATAAQCKKPIKNASQA
jgi:hypothetical protein